MPELAALLQASNRPVPDQLVDAFDLTLRRPGRVTLDLNCIVEWGDLMRAFQNVNIWLMIAFWVFPTSMLLIDAIMPC